MRIAVVVFLTLLATAAFAGDGFRVVDGDTFTLGDETIRIENIDAPETRKAKCDAERRLGKLAAVRLGELLAAGAIELKRNPAEPRDVDRYGRKLTGAAVGRQSSPVVLGYRELRRKRYLAAGYCVPFLHCLGSHRALPPDRRGAE